MNKSLTGLVLLCGAMAACVEGDDDTSFHDAGPPDARDGSMPIDVATADAPDGAPDAGDGGAIDAAPTPAGNTEVSWSVEQADGADGCGAIGHVSISSGSTLLALVPCADGKAQVEAPAGPKLVVRGLSASFATLGAGSGVPAEGKLAVTIRLTDEPAAQLEALRSAVDAYYDEHKEFPSIAATPNGKCCKAADGTCAVNENGWGDFQGLLGFSMKVPHRRQYVVESDEYSVRILAVADYDCDNVLVDDFVAGHVTPGGLVWDPPASHNHDD